jgi:hypothetical protein
MRKLIALAKPLVDGNKSREQFVDEFSDAEVFLVENSGEIVPIAIKLDSHIKPPSSAAHLQPVKVVLHDKTYVGYSILHPRSTRTLTLLTTAAI